MSSSESASTSRCQRIGRGSRLRFEMCVKVSLNIIAGSIVATTTRPSPNSSFLIAGERNVFSICVLYGREGGVAPKLPIEDSRNASRVR